jgi:AcrR family transcriptional regulator
VGHGSCLLHPCSPQPSLDFSERSSILRIVLGKPVRDRRVERHEATKAEILDAAWEFARTEGLAGVSLRDVAQRVGMQASSLYSYFESKNAIYGAMFAQGAQAYVDRRRQLDTTGDPLRDLQAHMRSFVQFCTEDSARYQLLFQRTIPGFEPSPESFAISVEGLGLTRTRLAAIGLDDPEVLDLLTAIGTGITDQQISNDPGGDRWSCLVDEAMEMFLNHVTNRTNRTKKPKARARS